MPKIDCHEESAVQEILELSKSRGYPFNDRLSLDSLNQYLDNAKAIRLRFQPSKLGDQTMPCYPDLSVFSKIEKKIILRIVAEFGMNPTKNDVINFFETRNIKINGYHSTQLKKKINFFADSAYQKLLPLLQKNLPPNPTNSEIISIASKLGYPITITNKKKLGEIRNYLALHTDIYQKSLKTVQRIELGQLDKELLIHFSNSLQIRSKSKTLIMLQRMVLIAFINRQIDIQELLENAQEISAVHLAQYTSILSGLRVHSSEQIKSG